MQQAVLHQAAAANPVRDLERIETPRAHRAPPPRGLTTEERRKLLDFVDTDRTAQNAGLPDLVRVALGSGLRIGELCTLRWIDLSLDGIPVVSAETCGASLCQHRRCFCSVVGWVAVGSGK